MASQKPERHKHSFDKIVTWLGTQPKRSRIYWGYEVVATCGCGKTKKREATEQEILAYIDEQACKHCGEDDVQHETTVGCFEELRNKVTQLQGEVDGLRARLRGV